MIIDRDKFIAEELIREHVSRRISLFLEQKKKTENKIRPLIHRLILEAETGTEEPSQYTGINVLADLLEKIVPIIEDDYKMLTTSDEQRESFRNHIVKAIKNTLKPIDTVDDAEKMKESIVFDIDPEILLEKVKINLDSDGDDPADAVAGEFIDIDAPEDTDQFVQIDDQNETGRNFAATTFKQVEKQIVDAYDMLADEEDQKMFYDYLITNMLLYFDKFEDELQPDLPNSTTPEYEEEKSASADGDTDNEEAAESDETNNQEADVDDIFADI
jgi:hypothetical protein